MSASKSAAKSAAEIRREFLDFFVAQGHREVPSSPVFPRDDPTLLFTNAGMNQFKDVFLGTGGRDYSRAVDTQKCIRVSGKHNDLEEVGVDTYHHTFFEMLGNWSFGDYFKQDAIRWAWQLLTEVWGMPKERLWVTVFGGDEADGLAADVDAERIWREETDIDPARILRCDKSDNFWEMGETGPCGPCSEIHIDRGGPDSDPADGADPAIGVNAGNERFIELWNLVFMEFNRLDDGSLVKLPARHVDTGMGFERVVSVLQGKSSNYDTDVFTPIFARIGELVGREYGGSDSQADVAFRVIADHVRAVSSAFADGALPSNVGRGYVLRRLIRRASRFGRQALGQEEPFLHAVVPAVVETLGEAFPEIQARTDHVQTLVKAEEEAFGKTLGRGLVRFTELANSVSEGGTLPGDQAFELYATYGFPRDLVELMARERGLEVDAAGWDEAEKAHQEASRSTGKFKQLLSAQELEGLEPTDSTCHDEGQTGTTLVSKIVRIVVGDEPDRVTVLLERSPFYAEGGGQVGDSGTLEATDGTFRIEVEDTRKMGAVVLHIGRIDFGEPSGRGAEVRASVDSDRRDRTRKNHTATHLMHKALREVLGDHVTQQGSYVGPERLRFDFSHTHGMTDEERERVERLVNGRIYANATVATTVEDLEGAKARGVTALFGEKYDERVRVVDVEGWSTELCGGTHVSAVGDIGPFVITSEGAIQAGVRRIEAVTGPEAVSWIQQQRRLLVEAARAVKSSPDELPGRIAQLQSQIKEARKKEALSSRADVEGAFERVKAALAERGGILAGSVTLDMNQAGLRDLASRVKSLAPDLAVALIGKDGDKAPWITLCQGRALEHGLDARSLIPPLRENLGGGGGGKPELAQGQGTNAGGIAAAEVATNELIAGALAEA